MQAARSVINSARRASQPTAESTSQWLVAAKPDPMGAVRPAGFVLLPSYVVGQSRGCSSPLIITKFATERHVVTLCHFDIVFEDLLLCCARIS